LNVWLRGFDPVHGYVVGNETEPMMIALLMRAWQTTYRAFDNTLKGYYPQALNLLRSPIEDWLAYWYLRSFPQEYERFTGMARGAPTFNDMLQRVEAKHFQGQPSPIIRDWIKRLHEYSHVERAGLQMVVLSSNTGVKLLIGPDQDAGAFEYCSADAVALIVPHLEALSNLRKSFGLPEVSEFDSFRRRVDAHHSVLAHQ
jgi:hypothetical protein